MKNLYRTLFWFSASVILVLTSLPVYAGNKDRAGQAAAPHLLINPWAATNGWGSAGVSFTKGIEATFSNIAGMAFSRKTEIAYTNIQYMLGSQVMINNLGLVQNLGQTKTGAERGNLGLTVMMMTFGKIPITTGDQPEGGLGTYSPSAMNLALSYARSFSENIHAGVKFNLVNQNSADVRASGFTIDLGVQYVSGRNDQFHIGITLRNIGLPMKYTGDGMNVRSYLSNNGFISSLSIPTEEAEMPTLLALGVSYDFLFGDNSENAGQGFKIRRENAIHRLSVAGSFIANAYSRDQIIFGVEYSWLDFFQVRGGYTITGGMYDEEAVSTSIFLGPSVGVSLLAPLKKDQLMSSSTDLTKKFTSSRLALDYSYRFTKEWKGCHAIGLRLIL
jgi:hypothetical protein